MVIYPIQFVIMSYGIYFYFPGSVLEFVCWFSIISNGRILIKHNKNNELNVFNGFKVLVMLSILYGHNCLIYATHPILYAGVFEKVIAIFPKDLNLVYTVVKLN